MDDTLALNRTSRPSRTKGSVNDHFAWLVANNDLSFAVLPNRTGRAYHIPMTDSESRGAGSAPIVWGAIPTPNKNFTGRTAILEHLRSGASSKVTAVVPEAEPQPKPTPLPKAVQGLGGVGKTAIAIEYA